MILTIILIALGFACGLWGKHERDTRLVPDWWDAPTGERIARLFPGLNLIMYRRYPKWGRHDRR